MKGTVAKGPVGWVMAVLVLTAGPWATPPAAPEAFFDAYTGKNFTRDADIRVRQPSLGNDFRVADVVTEVEIPIGGTRVFHEDLAADRRGGPPGPPSAPTPHAGRGSPEAPRARPHLFR